jgi:hypothetical protein
MTTLFASQIELSPTYPHLRDAGVNTLRVTFSAFASLITLAAEREVTKARHSPESYQ